jgi:Tfp pilus assembly protein PilX
MAATSYARPRTPQRGAALPIALILLAILMMLAVAGMRSAGVGFIMAGNEQFRQKAFIASEVGIEQALAFGSYNPSVPTVAMAGTVPNAATDNYTANINRQLNGVAQGAIWGSSWNSFSSFHFEVQSTGTSVRNSTTLHDQGLAVIAPFSSTYNPLAGGGNAL